MEQRNGGKSPRSPGRLNDGNELPEILKYGIITIKSPVLGEELRKVEKARVCSCL